MPTQDLLNNGSIWLAGILKQHAGREITYRRGGRSVTLRATIGATMREDVGEEGIAIEWRTTDYIFQPSLLVLGGVVTEPQDGDTIDDSVTGTTHVVSSDPGESAWRYDGPQRQLIRVSTKEA